MKYPHILFIITMSMLYTFVPTMGMDVAGSGPESYSEQIIQQNTLKQLDTDANARAEQIRLPQEIAQFRLKAQEQINLQQKATALEAAKNKNLTKLASVRQNKE